MLRKAVATMVALVVLSGWAQAADTEVAGKVVKVNADIKTIVIEAGGKAQEYVVDGATKILDAKGAPCKEGLKDKRLKAGARVVLVVASGKALKEVKLVAATTQPKPKETKGTPAKVLKVDVAKRTVEVEMAGKKQTLTLGADVKFLGPRGGVSDKGIKDDRFVAGNEVRIEMDASGKNVSVIHLPVRKASKDK